MVAIQAANCPEPHPISKTSLPSRISLAANESLTNSYHGPDPVSWLLCQSSYAGALAARRSATFLRARAKKSPRALRTVSSRSGPLQIPLKSPRSVTRSTANVAHRYLRNKLCGVVGKTATHNLCELNVAACGGQATIIVYTLSRLFRATPVRPQPPVPAQERWPQRRSTGRLGESSHITA